MSAAEIWLSRLEDRLRSELEQGDMPFLGFYSKQFNETNREYFHEKVLGHTSPIQLYIRGLTKWPAVFATCLTVHVVEATGALERGGQSVYYGGVWAVG